MNFNVLEVICVCDLCFLFHKESFRCLLAKDIYLFSNESSSFAFNI